MRTWDEARQESLKNDAEEAAAYLRLALAEKDDPLSLQAVYNVFAARGTLKGLGLTKAELVTLTEIVLPDAIAARRPRKATGKSAIAYARA
jgi:hypothetical protein